MFSQMCYGFVEYINDVRWLIFRDSLDYLCEFSVKLSPNYVSLENKLTVLSEELE